MAADYEPLLHTPDRLSWQIRGQAVKTMTEDSILNARGRRTAAKQPNPLAQQWADQMTQRFEPLSVAYPVFGQLRNCVDMAVVAALISHHDLLATANCELDVLLDQTRVRGPRYSVPEFVDSNASFLRGRSGWIVSVSGGVEVDSWSVVRQVQESTSLEAVRDRADARWRQRWWW